MPADGDHPLQQGGKGVKTGNDTKRKIHRNGKKGDHIQDQFIRIRPSVLVFCFMEKEDRQLSDQKIQ